MRRFREEPEKLPGTFVIKLVLDGLKAIREQTVPDAPEQDERSILDSIDALPRPHARKLLQREVDRLTGELARFNTKLEELA